MRKDGLVVALSPIPGLPLLLFGWMMTFSILQKGVGNLYYSAHIVAVTLLGTIGCMGLVLSSLEWTYTSRSRIVLARVCIAFGFSAVVIAFAFAVAELLFRNGGSLQGFWPLSVVAGLVSWPVVAGTIAMKKLKYG